MFKYEVGKVVNSFKKHAEGVHFDIDDSGATMMVFIQAPTTEEIEQFKSGKRFEIRFTELYRVIMITAKIGNLNWLDVPYSPHLSENLEKFQIPNEGEGLGLTLILIDALTGEVKHLRLLGLSERFTRQLFGIIMEEKTKDFDKAEYSNAVKKILSAYSINQIVKMSKDYCKMND